MSDRKTLERKARRLGASEFGPSKCAGKKWYVVYKGKKINFGQLGYEDFTQHRDPERRRRYLARATNIRDKDGRLTAKDRRRANYWAINLLW